MIWWKAITTLFGLFLSLYIYIRIFRIFELKRSSKICIFLLILLCSLGINLADFSFAHIVGETVYPFWRHAWYFLFVFILSLFTVVFLSDLLVGLPLYAVRRKITFPKGALYKFFLVLIAFSLACYGQFQGMKLPEIRKLTVTSSKIKSPMTLALLSDLHITRVSSTERIKGVVDLVNDLNPDLIVMPGDILDDEIRYIREPAEYLGELKAPLGVYFTSGNHEFYRGIFDAERLIGDFGITLMDNRGISVRDDFFLAGIPDLRSGRNFGRAPEMKKVLNLRNAEQYAVLLSHEPAAADGTDADLVLSGHTHGGQILPFQLFAWIFNSGYLAGLYDTPAEAKVFVSRGAGTWGPAVRQFAPSDIVLITFLPED